MYDSEEIPTTVDELRQYDQVILNNISNYDLGARVENSVRNTNMPENFVEMLEEYVSTYGGGMFTIGGKDGENANAYNRTDMYGSLYQQMLPVQAINYTPPLGVIFIIDVSGSMQGDPIELAKTGSVQCAGCAFRKRLHRHHDVVNRLRNGFASHAPYAGKQNLFRYQQYFYRRRHYVPRGDRARGTDFEKFSGN